MKVVVFKYYNSARDIEAMDDILPLMILILSRLPQKFPIFDYVDYFTDFVNTVDDRDFSFEEIYVLHFKVKKRKSVNVRVLWTISKTGGMWIIC